MRYLSILLLCIAAQPLAAQDSVSRPDSAKRFSFGFHVQTQFRFKFAYAFDPDSILSQRATLALSPSQAARVEVETRVAMAMFAPLKAKLAEQQAELDRLLAAPTIDETAATAALDGVMQLENTIKRLRLKLLIRNKNTLAPGQQQLRWQFGKATP